MDRVGWTTERNNCERWSSLDPDLLVIVAKHCDATSVCRLSQACTEWRDAVARQAEQIWKPLVRADFRRTASLLKALPPQPDFSYAKHYREQHKAQESKLVGRQRTKTTCHLSDFVFTLELVTGGGTRRVVADWTGTLDTVSHNGSFTCPMSNLREWRKTWNMFDPPKFGMVRGDGTIPMRLEVYVSRALSGEVKTRKIFASDAMYDDEPEDGLYIFGSESLEMTRPLDDEHADVPMLRLWLDRPYRAIDLEFEMFHPDMDFDELRPEDLLSYLEHGIDWN